MSEHKILLGVFPGTFDPVTNGHVDIILRAAGLLDELVVAVGENPEKASTLSAAERADIIRQVVSGIGNVRVETYRGLTLDFARRVGAGVLVRGLRGPADLDFESRVALTNRRVTGLETIFILPAPEYAYISSSLVRQIAREGGDISSLVPPQVLGRLGA